MGGHPGTYSWVTDWTLIINGDEYGVSLEGDNLELQWRELSGVTYTFVGEEWLRKLRGSTGTRAYLLGCSALARTDDASAMEHCISPDSCS
jgi:hypothetical protein